jgi:hypothetical protein
MADAFTHAQKNNIKGYELLLVGAEYHIIFVSEQCGLTFVNFMYYRILMF